MSLIDPVGPLPPGVYWRRRIVVLAIVLAFILFIWWLFAGRSGGSAPTPAPVPGPTSSPTTTPGPTQSPSGSATPTPTGSGSKCTDSQIEVKVLADPDTSPMGSSMQLTLLITNISPSACTRDVGAAQNELQVATANDRLWSSDDCSPSKEEKLQVLQPNENFVAAVTWDQRTSRPGCPTSRVEVDPGVYDVYGRNGEVVSDATTITITKN